MATTDATRAEPSTAAPLASFCRRKDHGLCQAAQARCGCPCHGPDGQQPPGPRLTAVKPAPPTLAERLDAFEARLPADLLDMWRPLRRELTGTLEPATVAGPVPRPSRTDGREVTCPDCHEPRMVSQQLESEIRRGKRPGICWDCRRARKNPTPTTRICSRCRVAKPVDEYNRDGHGGLDGRCNQCKADIARERYLRVGQVAIDIELLDGDELVGQICPGCHTPFFAGERVVAGHICHMGCEA